MSTALKSKILRSARRDESVLVGVAAARSVGEFSQFESKLYDSQGDKHNRNPQLEYSPQEALQFRQAGPTTGLVEMTDERLFTISRTGTYKIDVSIPTTTGGVISLYVGGTAPIYDDGAYYYPSRIGVAPGNYMITGSMVYGFSGPTTFSLRADPEVSSGITYATPTGIGYQVASVFISLLSPVVCINPADLDPDVVM